MPPRTFRSYDPYAWARCQCGHLQYRDQEPGGDCQFCSCADHRAAGTTVPGPEREAVSGADA